LEEILKENVNNARRNKKSNKELKIEKQRRWLVFITIWTLFLSIGINLVSELFLNNSDILVSFFILIIIVITGIFFDMVGIAVASTNITPFNSMAANRVKGSKEAVDIVKNASQVSNFCNDVVGDICGIVSGATAISIVFQLGSRFEFMETTVLAVILNGLLAAVTVGGKALGKNIAMEKSTQIVYRFGYIIAFFKKPFGKVKGGRDIG
jgi:CBS domain containing-hemolysin-like protein